MKVQTLRLTNFKRFDFLPLDFRDLETGLAEDLIVLMGQNGSGKTSVLQALAAMLGAATHRLPGPAKLDWLDFDLGLANKAWARPIGIEMDVEFSQDEVEATRDYFARTDMGQDPDKVPPGQNRVASCVTIRIQLRSKRRPLRRCFSFSAGVMQA